MKSKTFYERVSLKKTRIADYIPDPEARHKELVRVLKEGHLNIKSSLQKWGESLLECRDLGVWNKNHLSFKDFCFDELGISDRYARYIMDGVEVIGSLPPDLRAKVTTEAQTRALLKMPEAHRVPVFESCVKTGCVAAPDLTDRHQTLLVTKVLQSGTRVPPSVSVKTGSKPMPNPVIKKNAKIEPVYDCVGKIIPSESLPYWEKGKEFGKWIGPVRIAFEQADKQLKSSYPLFSKVPRSVVERLTQCFEDLRLSMPYAVCQKCRGEPSLNPYGCNYCSNIGMICKADYEKLSVPVAS